MFVSILSTAGFVLVASQLHAAFKPNQDRDAPHLSDLFTSKGKEIWRNGPTATVAAAQLLWSLPADASCPALVMEVIHHYPENSHRNHTNLLTILQDTRLVRESLRHGVLLAAVAQPATTERILTLLIWHWLAHAGSLLGRVGKSGTNRPFRFRFRGGNRT